MQPVLLPVLWSFMALPPAVVLVVLAHTVGTAAGQVAMGTLFFHWLGLGTLLWVCRAELLPRDDPKETL